MPIPFASSMTEPKAFKITEFDVDDRRHMGGMLDRLALFLLLTSYFDHLPRALSLLLKPEVGMFLAN
jgi:hypothetical protein